MSSSDTSTFAEDAKSVKDTFSCHNRAVSRAPKPGWVPRRLARNTSSLVALCRRKAAARRPGRPNNTNRRDARETSTKLASRTCRRSAVAAAAAAAARAGSSSRARSKNQNRSSRRATTAKKTPHAVSICASSSVGRYSRSTPLRLGWRSLRSALASIWRMRSRVTLNTLPISSSVFTRPSSKP